MPLLPAFFSAVLVALLMPAAMAQDAVLPKDDPFQLDFYSKLYDYKAPDGRRGVPSVKLGAKGIEVGLWYLEERLRDLREARDGFLDMCISSHAERQVVTYKGRRVLGSPDWLRSCNRRADILIKGVQGLSEAFRQWNPIAGSSYVHPRLDQRDLDAWTRMKSSFLHFDGGPCDAASHDIAVRVQLGQVSHEQAYERHKTLCGPEWAKLFEPSRPGQVKPKGNAKGEASGEVQGEVKGPSLDASLDQIEAGQYEQGAAGAQTVDPARDAMLRSAREKGSGLQTSVQDSAAHAGASTREAVQQSGVFAEVASQLDQMTGDPGSPGIPTASQGCDAAAEQAAMKRYADALTARAQGMSIETGQCFNARVVLQLARRQLGFMQRCGSGPATGPVQAEIRRLEGEERDLCAAVGRSSAVAQRPPARPSSGAVSPGTSTPSKPPAQSSPSRCNPSSDPCRCRSRCVK